MPEVFDPLTILFIHNIAPVIYAWIWVQIKFYLYVSLLAVGIFVDSCNVTCTIYANDFNIVCVCFCHFYILHAIGRCNKVY